MTERMTSSSIRSYSRNFLVATVFSIRRFRVFARPAGVPWITCEWEWEGRPLASASASASAHPFGWSIRHRLSVHLLARSVARLSVDRGWGRREIGERAQPAPTQEPEVSKGEGH